LERSFLLRAPGPRYSSFASLGATRGCLAGSGGICARIGVALDAQRNGCFVRLAEVTLADAPKRVVDRMAIQAVLPSELNDSDPVVAKMLSGLLWCV